MDNLHKFCKTARSYSTQQPYWYQRHQFQRQPFNISFNHTNNHIDCTSHRCLLDPTQVHLHLQHLPFDFNNNNHVDNSFDTHKRRVTSIHGPLLSTFQTRLHPFISAWYWITNDQWVLSIVQNSYFTEFQHTPPSGTIKTTPYSLALREEVSLLLQNQLSRPSTPSYVSLQDEQYS